MDKLQELKAKCFDLQEANTSLSNYLVEIAKVLNLSDINHIYPSVVKLVEENKKIQVDQPE